MHRSSLLLVASCCLLTVTQVGARAGTDAKKPLQGVWIAKSMEVDGKALPAEEAKRMRFTFKGAKLFVKGGYKKDDQEEECDYKLDVMKSPHHLDITRRDEGKTVQAIYEIRDGVLKICIRHEGSSEGRPKEFATTPESKLILLVLTKQNP